MHWQNDIGRVPCNTADEQVPTGNKRSHTPSRPLAAAAVLSHTASSWWVAGYGSHGSMEHASKFLPLHCSLCGSAQVSVQSLEELVTCAEPVAQGSCKACMSVARSLC